MNFKEKLKRMKLLFSLEKELEELNENINQNKIKLKQIEEEIITKKEMVEILETELIELKDFINSTFEEENPNFDYKVNITHCYIISLNGKKYISLRQHSKDRSNWYTLATGNYNVETYKYYDALNIDENGKYKYLYGYKYGYFDSSYEKERYVNSKPDYEIHILELYPELSVFVDNYVPNTYLMKVYYEINELASKKLNKKI